MIKSGASCTSPVYEPASTSPFQASSHPMSFVGEKSVSQHNSSPFLLLHIFLVGFSVRLRSRKDSHGEGKAEKNNPGWSKFGSENPPPANFPAPTPSMILIIIIINGFQCKRVDYHHQQSFKAKGIAGSIVHAVAKTNAIVAGLIVIEAIKVLKKDVDKYVHWCTVTKLYLYEHMRLKIYEKYIISIFSLTMCDEMIPHRTRKNRLDTVKKNCKGQQEREISDCFYDGFT
ncbi:LOW QUALITY PROTEIN: hypothetical protein YC2023_034295 [Brassica napus]